MLPKLPARDKGKSPKEYLNASFKSMFRLCLNIINLIKRFLFAINGISLPLRLHVTHLLNLENFSKLIILRRSKKSLDFLIHYSSINVSIRSMLSLTSLSKSNTNFSVANTPFDILSKGFSLNESVKRLL